VSPPTERPSASRGVLDPPSAGGAARSPLNAPWEAPGHDIWAGGALDPLARSAGSAGDVTAPPSGGRYGQHSAGRRGVANYVIPARRWPRRILVAVNIIVTVMLIAAGTVYGYVNWRFSQIHRISIPSIVGAITGRAAPPGAPMTILVVGSDSRAGDTGSDSQQFGSSSAVGGQRSDTIMLLHVDPASTKATLMSIPRDLWVQIPGTTTHDRINSTFDNGPDLLVKTIEADLGIPIDHYVEVDFQSFRDVVNAVGGVKEYFPTPARDAFSLLNIPNPGCYTMTGDMALSFVRARHYEYKVDGRWVYEAESDLARIKRQQSFIKKMISKAQSSGLTNPLELNNIIAGVTKNLTLDKGFSQALLLSLAKRFRNLSPDSLPTATLPTNPAVIGGADVLLLQPTQAQQAINDFLNPGHSATTSTTNGGPSTTSGILPSTVRVAVLNGTGRTGEAGAASNSLRSEGFTVTASQSANNFNYTTTQIRYRPGNEAKAELLASAVKGESQLQADSSIQNADVELITGQTYQGISTRPLGGATVTTTPTVSTSSPATPPTTTYELPGTPSGFVAPAC
jgi:LCP family protein required for cell wall assembly